MSETHQIINDNSSLFIFRNVKQEVGLAVLTFFLYTELYLEDPPSYQWQCFFITVIHNYSYAVYTMGTGTSISTGDM